MNPHPLLRLPALLASLVLLAIAPAHAGLITNDPGIPPENGNYYTTPPNSIFATYIGAGLFIFVSDITLDLTGISRNPSGPDEIANYTALFSGSMTINGGPLSPFAVAGPGTTLALNKIGNTTGTFQTEMLQMDLSGAAPSYGPIRFRESPTLSSLGQTTVTNAGGGLFQIDSFFDVFTEISIDQGQTWIPSQGPPSHIELEPVPEPGTAVFVAALGALSMVARRRRRSEMVPEAS